MNFLTSSLFLFLLNDYILNHYPEFHQKYLIIISYSLLNLYSRIKIYCKNIFEELNKNKDINNIIQYWVIFFNLNNKSIDFNIEKIFDNKIQKTFLIENADEFTNNIDDINDSNDINNTNDSNDIFFIITDLKSYTNNNNKINKKICHSYPFSLNYTLCSIQFLLIEIIIGEKNYIIYLKNDSSIMPGYNYYITENVFDKKFFLYFLNNHTTYKLNVCNNTDNITVKIIDHNVKTIEIDLSKNESIKLTKDSYIIQNTQ